MSLYGTVGPVSTHLLMLVVFGSINISSIVHYHLIIKVMQHILTEG